MPTASSLAWKTSLEKVRTLWHCNRLRSVALYLWLIVVISVRQSTVAAISGLHCRALVMVSSSRLTAVIREAGGTVREIDVWASHVISALVICIIVCLSWAVNHYRDNAITYKAQRDKNARRELKLANAAITDMQMRQRDVAALDAKYTRSWLMLKLKMMLCVMMLPLVVVGCSKAVCRSVHEATTASGVDNAASPTGRHRWTRLFHPERGDPRKNSGRTGECHRDDAGSCAHINLNNSCNHREQYTRASSGV